MQFLQPLWLYASAGIIIPVIIHLWNVRQGKILKVGSVSLLTQSDRQQARSLKLKDLLLLVLRCLLIITLAMLLASPFYNKPLTVQDEKGWILITRQDAEPAYNQHKTFIDSLIATGCSFHFLEPGFPVANLGEALKKPGGKQEVTLDYWALIKALDQQVPAELPVYVFTNDLLAHYLGSRPAVALNLQWKTFSSADTNAIYNVQAYPGVNDKVLWSVANSTPLATTVVTTERPFSSVQDSIYLGPYKTNAEPYTIDTTGKLPLDTSTLRVVIYNSGYAKDAGYLQAGLQAIANFTRRKIKVVSAAKAGDIPRNCQWLFWLSDQPVPNQFRASHVLHYAVGKVQVQPSYLYNNLDNNESIALQKRIALLSQNVNNIPLWEDGFGNSLLTLQPGERNLYTFYSRFNPMWNDLVWSKAFPEMLMELLYGSGEGKVHPLDRRKIELAQLRPVIQKNGATQKAKFNRLIDLTRVLWGIAFFIFLLERYISFTTKKGAANG